MKLIDSILYIELGELVECGFKESSLITAKSKGTKCWSFINDPDDKRKVLVDYEAMTQENKNKVIDRYGNPYDRVARKPILDMIIPDAKAEEFYKNHRYGKHEFLTIETRNKYTRGASWLNMLGKVQDDRTIIKKSLGLSVPEFYMHVGTLIKSEILNGKSKTYTGFHVLPGNFPATYQRLMDKVKAYRASGYEHMIDSMYGNKIAAKLGKTEDGFDEELERKQIAVIRRIASMHNNLNASQVTRLSNIIFNENGWNTISDSRVAQIMEEYELELTPGRRGKRAFTSNMSMQVKREAPKFPTYFWTLDGWTVELLYQNKERYDNRLVMVVVLDAVNKYPVGYAIGDRENAELIRQANRNAIMHMQELFGNCYRPHQLQSDRYQLKHLTPFYNAIAHLHTPAAVGNAKAKPIEPYFKYLNKEYCQLSKNWSGFNVDASKKNQVNREMLDLIKKSFPDRNGVIQQIERFMEIERSRKIAQFVEAWEQMPTDDRLIMNRMDWLMTFGVPIGKTNTITGQGIIKMIDGQQITFDCFDPLFRKNVNVNWQIIADINNLSEVLAISPDGKLKYILERKMTIPMDIKSTTPEHREYLKKINNYNKEQRDKIIDMYTEDAGIVDDIMRTTPLSLGSHEETALKLMLTTNGQQKEGIQNAKRLKPAPAQIEAPTQKETKQEQQEWQQIQAEYMSQKTDFNHYLD